jgi:hypothetical protein
MIHFADFNKYYLNQDFILKGSGNFFVFWLLVFAQYELKNADKTPQNNLKERKSHESNTHVAGWDTNPCNYHSTTYFIINFERKN